MTWRHSETGMEGVSEGLEYALILLYRALRGDSLSILREFFLIIIPGSSSRRTARDVDQCVLIARRRIDARHVGTYTSRNPSSGSTPAR